MAPADAADGLAELEHPRTDRIVMEPPDEE
jgi:hypothetical protein